MAITNRAELIETLTNVGVMGAARLGELDALFTGGPVPVATTTVIGGVKKTVAVVDIEAQTVTDIATAQTAIDVIVAKVNALLAAQRTAGQVTV